MDYALIWAGIIAFAVLTYALLDGFDLGVGILFPFFSDADKDSAIGTLAPIWDGNETWLVLGGGGLFAVFPMAYAVLLTAFYPLVIAMLIALVFRGASLEYREKTTGWKPFWNLGFCLGSLVAALCQGIMLGAFIQGVDIQQRNYAGGWFDWLTPYSLTCGIAIVVGYALLGGSWVVMKTRSLSVTLRPQLTTITVALFTLIVIVSTWTLFLDARLTARWFVWPNMLIFAPIPLLVAGLVFSLLRAIRTSGDTAPFLLAQALFVVTYAGFGISTYPYIIPHQVEIWEAAAPDSSLKFLLVGTVVLLPIILGYTAHCYWVFRGKIEDGQGYGH
ncbi:MAG: cytochrome d ubiquinol oxidase subunit II [Pseudomonadales bacterium]